jgi:hypothetical protein
MWYSELPHDGGPVEPEGHRPHRSTTLNPQNPKNVPMKLSDIVRAVSSEQTLVVAALDALSEQQPPLVEENVPFQQDRTFNITGSGVRFVRNIPQGFASAL